MEVSGLLPVFLCAAFGGVLMELLKWHQLREAPTFPTYAASPVFWAATLGMILAAGALGVLYGTTPRNAIMVLNVGLSAPLLLKTWAEKNAPLPQAPGAPPPGAPRKNEAPEPPRIPGFKREADRTEPWQDVEAGGDRPSLLSFLAWR